MLVGRLGLEDESYDARLLRGIDDELNPLQPVNRMCFLLKCFLRAHSFKGKVGCHFAASSFFFAQLQLHNSVAVGVQFFA